MYYLRRYHMREINKGAVRTEKFDFLHVDFRIYAEREFKKTVRRRNEKNIHVVMKLPTHFRNKGKFAAEKKH